MVYVDWYYSEVDWIRESNNESLMVELVQEWMSDNVAQRVPHVKGELDNCIHLKDAF
jgi:hypothetical protein